MVSDAIKHLAKPGVADGVLLCSSNAGRVAGMIPVGFIARFVCAGAQDAATVKDAEAFEAVRETLKANREVEMEYHGVAPLTGHPTTNGRVTREADAKDLVVPESKAECGRMAWFGLDDAVCDRQKHRS